MNRFSKPRWLLFYIPLVLVTGCGPNTGSSPEETAIPVSTHQVTTRDLPETLLLPGRVVAKQETQVSATLPGKVAQVYSQLGDKVQSGQLLATLETPGASSNVAQARAALRSLEEQYARMKNMNGGGEVSDQEIAALKQQVDTRLARLGELSQAMFPDRKEMETVARELADLQTKLTALTTQQAVSKNLNSFRAPLLQGMEGQIAQARQAVQLAEAQANAGRITSPIDGVVLSAMAAKGSPAAPGFPLFSVGNTQQVDFEILVDPAEQARLKAGQQVTLQVESLPAIQSQIASVSPALQPQQKSFTARAPLTAATETYKPGMFGQAVITVNPHQGVLALPKQTVLRDSKGTYVIQVQEKRAVQVRVETGYDNGTWVEIRKGLKKGDTVVLEGIERIGPNSLLQVVNQNQKTEPAK